MSRVGFMAEASRSPVISVCGLSCSDCGYYKAGNCAGCYAQHGNLFWGSCPIYRCCVNEKGLGHCGHCPDLPCRTILETRDPSVPLDQHLEGIKARKAALLELVSKDSHGATPRPEPV